MKVLTLGLAAAWVVLFAQAALAQPVNLEVEDADIIATFGYQFGSSTIDGGYPTDPAGPGIRLQITPTVSSGFWDMGFGDNYPIATGTYGFPVNTSSPFFGDWTAYSVYEASFTNNSTSDWAYVKPYLNIGVVGTYYSAGGVWVPPGETVIETLDLAPISPLNEISQFGFQIGSNFGSTNNYDATHLDLTISLAEVPSVAPDMSALCCISTVDTCCTIPFVFDRAADATPARGISVTFELNDKLDLCESMATSITQGSWLDGHGTAFQVYQVNDSTYTVDQAILGGSCTTSPVTTGGVVFSVSVRKAAAVSDGTGVLTVTDVQVRDCANPSVPLAGQPGVPGSLTIDTTAPAAVADLDAVQVKTGNDADGTTDIALTFSGVETDATVAVYRKGTGLYPEYDDAGPVAAPGAPADPVTALGAGWTLSTVTTSGGADETNLVRDFFWFTAFVTDTCGNVSAVSNLTDGTLNYHLGDFVPLTLFGNNAVDVDDISKLGFHYGTTDGVDALYLDTLDVGPTSTSSTDGLPDTDDAIQFEDLIITAINYSIVGKPRGDVFPADRNAAVLRVPEAKGSTFDVAIELASDGSVQGLSIPLLWDASIVEPVGYVAGEFLDRQPGMGVLFSPDDGVLDAAVFGGTFYGDGVLATMTFKVKAAGDPGLGVGEITARDSRNRPIQIPLEVTGSEALPIATRILPASPNPFGAGTMIRLTLAEASRVQVHVYTVDGSLVRALVDRMLPSGEQTFVWDGLDSAGRSVASGAYLIRSEVGTIVQTQRVVRLQ